MNKNRKYKEDDIKYDDDGEPYIEYKYTVDANTISNRIYLSERNSNFEMETVINNYFLNLNELSEKFSNKEIEIVSIKSDKDGNILVMSRNNKN